MEMSGNSIRILGIYSRALAGVVGGGGTGFRTYVPSWLIYSFNRHHNNIVFHGQVNCILAERQPCALKPWPLRITHDSSRALSSTRHSL